MLACVAIATAPAPPPPTLTTEDAAQDPRQITAAGDDQRAWVLCESVDGTTVLFVVPREPLGQARSAATFPTMPAALAATDGDAAILFEPAPESDAPRRARLVDVTTQPGGRKLLSPPAPLPPLPRDAAIRGFASAGDAAAVLLRRQSEPEPVSDDESSGGTTHELRVLAPTAWEIIDFPPDLVADQSSLDNVRLISSSLGVALLAPSSDFEIATIWTRRQTRHATDEEPPVFAWQPTRVTLPQEPHRLLTIEGQPWALVHGPGDTLSILKPWGDELVTQATVESVPDTFVAAALAGDILLAWPKTDDPPAIVVHVVNTEGVTLHRDDARPAGPVSTNDLQLIVLIVAAIAVTAMLFIARPPRPEGVTPIIPDGTVLATPSRRIIAFVIDLVPGVVFALFIWGSEAQTAQDAVNELNQAGIAPFLVIGGVTLIHATITEALFGCTLGKLMTRCRTVDYQGNVPGWWRAFSRTLIKVVCPPIGLFTVLAPALPHPASFETIVVMPRPRDADPPEEGR